MASPIANEMFEHHWQIRAMATETATISEHNRVRPLSFMKSTSSVLSINTQSSTGSSSSQLARASFNAFAPCRKNWSDVKVSKAGYQCAKSHGMHPPFRLRLSCLPTMSEGTEAFTFQSGYWYWCVAHMILGQKPWTNPNPKLWSLSCAANQIHTGYFATICSRNFCDHLQLNLMWTSEHAKCFACELVKK